MAVNDFVAELIELGHEDARIVHPGCVVWTWPVETGPLSFLGARVPEGAPEPEPVPEVPTEPVPGAATEPEAPSLRVKPAPAYAETRVAGCQETGMRVVIGCGGCAGSAP